MRKILQLRKRLGLNQSEFAARLNYSAMALSRWESGTHEPTAEAYVRMGNLAEGRRIQLVLDPRGLEERRPVAHVSGRVRSAAKVDFPEFEIVMAGSGGKRRRTGQTKTKLVAMPVLAVHAGTHGAKGDQILDLDQRRSFGNDRGAGVVVPEPGIDQLLAGARSLR